ncbi:DUF4352 domain-containing protein [Limnofasciculus baicalensis]|uniref:DUF4352 domain-containing protein n=1 Tax=Limnofasciculus baicalensis BBK-W-15 TaxID=2699891 RepID=A0AAE3GT22_9CYAN|nr:DUF4352 domain-containing protein [Limnofasciculus baicalensis]MCP2729462.1 DUF4352 domain-containing protein [Limnofasciculus baicalensis BBK-W-15]
MKLIKHIISTPITIVIALFMGCSDRNVPQLNTESESTSRNQSSQKNSSIPPSPKHTYKIADAISITDKNLNLQFTVNGTREHPGKGVIKPNQGHKWILVNTTIANKGQESKKFSVISFAMMDGQNNTYDVALLAGALEDVESPTGDISPGEKRQGEVAFEVPGNSKGLKLLFKPNSSICDRSANEPKALVDINCQPILVNLD